ncbi:MAG TPA: SDR family oxidoreductase [Candidatus Binataceae bacterium]|nr:SDR family oxidoreductase [Candidatus Binataceae bacterium]
MDSLDSLFSLRGHLGLVTGASSGLGVECAYALAIAGADVALVARRAERVAALAAELREKYRVRSLAMACDVTDDEAIARALARIRTELGEIDILINNAGISPTGPAEKFPRADWDATIATNLTAPMVLSQQVAARLIELGRPGRIINITSVLAAHGSAVYRLASYTAAKGALANLTRQLAIEWARYGILVNAIAPGWIPTEATAGGIAKPKWRERMETFTPMARLGRPEEIRGAVIYLASPAASYVTGTTIAVDGGYQAW